MASRKRSPIICTNNKKETGVDKKDHSLELERPKTKCSGWIDEQRMIDEHLSWVFLVSQGLSLGLIPFQSRKLAVTRMCLASVTHLLGQRPATSRLKSQKGRRGRKPVANSLPDLVVLHSCRFGHDT